MASFPDKSTNYSEFKGFQPAADYVSKKIKKKIFERDVPGFLDYLQVRTASDVVNKSRDLVSQMGISCGAPGEKPYFVSDGDMGFASGSESSYALVRPGKPGAPLRIILAHSDTPCLRVTPQPVYMQSDADHSLAYPSFSLITRPYGGIRVEDWQGMDVDIVGNLYGGKTRKINFPGRIKQMSLHVDAGDETRRPSELKVDTGVRTMKELYKMLGIKDGMDFARAQLYAVPHFAGTNGRLVGNELGAYGLDDRASLWAATKAGLESIVNDDSENTIMIFGLDKEEIGSTGGNGGYRGFFESVVKDTLKIIYGDEAKDFDLPLDFRRKLLGRMPVISADCDIALADLEIEQIGDTIDFHNSAKTGWGPYIAADGPEWGQRDVSPEHIAALMKLFGEGFGGRKPRDKFHMIGKCTAYDSDFSSDTMAGVFDKYFPCVDVGLPVIGLHNPRAETVNVFDLHWEKEGFRLYLDSD